MSRPVLVSSLAALAALAVTAGVVGSPVGTADAARPFAPTKGQFTALKKTSQLALATSKKNTKAITALKQQGVAAGAQGPQGPAGPAGGFDPASVTRVQGASVTVDPAHAWDSRTVTCPAGAIALSGGWYLELAADENLFTVARSTPSADLDSWYFAFSYSGPVARSVSPYVICAGS